MKLPGFIAFAIFVVAFVDQAEANKRKFADWC